MKSLFKRSLAAATSSLLALTQLASMAGVNISAVETAAAANGIDISMDAILDIPVSSDDFKTAPVDGMVWAGKTEIGNRIDAALRSGSDKQFTVSATSMRERAQSVLAGRNLLTPAEIDEIINQIGDANVTVTTDGEATIEIELGEIGPTVGPAFERFVQKALNIDFDDPEAPIVVDWTGYSIAGKIVVNAVADFDTNTVTYTTSITDEKGEALEGYQALIDYVIEKLDDASNRVLKSAQDTKNEKQADVDDYQKQKNEKQAEKNVRQEELDKAVADFEDAVAQGADEKTVLEKKQEVADAQAKLDDAQAKLDDAQAQLDEAYVALADAQNKLDKAKSNLDNAKDKIRSANKIVEAVAAISETDSTVDGLYAALVQDGKDIIDKTDLSDARKNQIKNKIDEKKPASALEALDNEKVQKAYDAAVSKINENYGDIATISVSLDDIKAVITDAESQQKPEFAAKYTVDGYSGSAILYVTDDQQDELLAAALESNQTAEDFYNAGWTVVLGAEDGELVTDFSDATKDYEIIQVVSRKQISVAADTDYVLNGSVKFDVQRVITQIVVKEIVVTTTTTTSTTTETTTTDTTTTVTDTTASSSASTDATTVSTSVSTDETTTSATDNTDGSDVTTTYATYVSFDIKGVEDKGLVYWSEETTPFDISNLSITLRVYEAGVATDLAIDVTDAFELEQKSPAEIKLPEGFGLSGNKVFFALKDVEAVTGALKDAGYGDDLIAQEGIKEGYRAGNLLVYLVLRGDTDLNGVVDVVDAQLALDYYSNTILGMQDADYIFNDIEAAYLKPGGEPLDQEKLYPFSHYAMDVYDGGGVITVEDSQWILQYYSERLAFHDDWDWDKVMTDLAGEYVNVPVIPRDELHANPLMYDNHAGEYADRGLDYSAAQEVE